MNFGFLILDFGLRRKHANEKSSLRILNFCSDSLKSKMSSYDPIRPLEHVERNCQTNLFCCLKVYDEFKLRRLLHRQISRFGAFQDLIQ